MTNAIFANARASALQASLLGADRLNRMVDCASGDDALKILSEVNFGNGVTVASALEADLLIEAEERRYTAFVRETAPSEALCRYLLAEYDYHNAEAIVRSKYMKTDCAPMQGADGF